MLWYNTFSSMPPATFITDKWLLSYFTELNYQRWKQCKSMTVNLNIWLHMIFEGCHFVLLLETELSSFLIDEHNEVHEAYCCSDPHDSTKAALSTANHQVYRESPLHWSTILSAWGGELTGTTLPGAARDWPSMAASIPGGQSKSMAHKSIIFWLEVPPLS